ncbi:Integral membrane sensor signal transduction histidine kinase [Verrucomicrobia bacterium]|nr:Integral membrane sensor signal transduction histidine kinase [Verrucomicrobiota bacterium]
MKKVALVFVAAVFVPSLVLGWLAVRTLRDQQFLLERQQSLLYQGVADALAKAVQDALAEDLRSFASQVADLLRGQEPADVAASFDDLLLEKWPLAEVGFVVSLKGDLLSPSPLGRPEARTFCADNSRFLCNRQSVEVYLNSKQFLAKSSINAQAQNPLRNVVPEQNKEALGENQQAASKIAASEAEFRQLIAGETQGTIARFVDNKLDVLLWWRGAVDSPLIFGAQLALPRLAGGLQPLLERLDPALRGTICVALLDDAAKPVALSQPGFRAAWKRPFVATEIGEALPHWEVAVYLLDPARLTQSARIIELTLGLLIAVLLMAITIGSWLIVADLKRQLALARQKTDFVSNVSHELKTPLTSIRMFSELLAEQPVTNPEKHRAYLSIITAETARLTRLINNVLDFARLERGEKKYHFTRLDLAAVVRETVETYRPQLEAGGFRFEVEIPDSPLWVRGDRDALAQVLMNLLSNAEKYSEGRKEITVRAGPGPTGCVEVKVLDRGLGVPEGCAERIFEQFYRAHDSVSSGIQGCGLGLTLARQMARAHGGDAVYEAREGGGSCFSLRVPIETKADS